jgi:uncharacterized protein (DUF1501 family)
MKTTRRRFIKLGAGAVTVGVLLPDILIRQAQAQTGRKLVIIQFEGGNDGLNTVIPYTDAEYYRIRPRLALRENELQSGGLSTLLNDRLALHPAMIDIKRLYDQGKVAIALGAGYPDSTLSHFEAMEVWQTADPTGLSRTGWLGKYAEVALVSEGLPAASFGGELPRALYSSRVVIPNIRDFSSYNFLTDPHYPDDYDSQYNTFLRAASRRFTGGGFLSDVNNTMLASVRGAERVQTAVESYNSTVTYPDDNPLAAGLRMAAQVMTTLPEAFLMHVNVGGFDTHSDQIEISDGAPNRRSGAHATLLRWFSEAVKAFYDDMAAHNLADRVLMMQWSEFGRRPEENASLGTDHSTSGPMFIIGNGVKGGLYGQQPSLRESDLDDGGNPGFHVDFREVYATILDRWLNFDSRLALGARFPDVGFL